MRKFFFAGLAGVLMLSVQSARAGVPVVVELYTSQSCSSCPKADALFEKLAVDENIITVSCHVDYWDHLGWRDRFSMPECTQRQRDFGQKLDGGRIYTPEAVVNGRASMVGYRDDLIEQAVEKQRRDAKTASLTFEKLPDGYALIFPELPKGKQIPYQVTLMAYGHQETVAIGGGENDGAKITYAKPAILVKNLGTWNGNASSRTVAFSTLPAGVAGFVVTAQPEPGAPFVAAGEYKIK